MDSRYDPEALRVARQATATGEQVLWAGRPGAAVWLSWELAHPLGLLVVVGGSLLWNLRDRTGLLSERPGLVAVMTIPLWAFAGWLALAAWSRRKRAREVYAVTSRRVLILADDGTVRHAVGLEAAPDFRVQGRTLWLGGLDEVVAAGRGDLDGGLDRMERLPRLRGLADPERVMATIRTAAA
ncbi:hypothetical protein [Brevundimonas lenta]|uniref:Uncharacterized protein n=1 Tax=Brevundimonas lenta TaxID=424796 RepID=A0A7W6NRI5_9CAUL|nr:hypothetical protein [Brevundimonas lenta]MBB4084215.1 hypothetical protein [Brevundimonas lenta]